MKNKIIKLSLIIVLIVSFSCYVGEPYIARFPAGTVQGYRPVYATQAEAQIEWQTARALNKPGKIYVYNNYLLVNEKLEGVHVFDNSNPANPVSVGFLRVPGSTDMAIEGDVLYVNHINDLVALQFSDFETIEEISRTPQRDWLGNFPLERGTYFECADPSKGLVVGWELTTLNNPKCYR
jgi:hypothetical protein